VRPKRRPPRKRKPNEAQAGTENRLQARCEALLGELVAMGRVLAVIHRPNHAPTAQEKRQRGTKGQADLTMLLPGGRYCCVELKTTTGRESLEQIAWRVKLEPYSAICRSEGEFLDFVGRWI